MISETGRRNAQFVATCPQLAFFINKKTTKDEKANLQAGECMSFNRKFFLANTAKARFSIPKKKARIEIKRWPLHIDRKCIAAQQTQLASFFRIHYANVLYCHQWDPLTLDTRSRAKVKWRNWSSWRLRFFHFSTLECGSICRHWGKVVGTRLRFKRKNLTLFFVWQTKMFSYVYFTAWPLQLASLFICASEERVHCSPAVGCTTWSSLAFTFLFDIHFFDSQSCPFILWTLFCINYFPLRSSLDDFRAFHLISKSFLFRDVLWYQRR